MSLYDDIQLAQRLLDERLSSATKPTEKEARAAARRVLETIGNDLRASWKGSDLATPGIIVFLYSLANALDPDGVAKTAKRIYTRKIGFKDTSRGAKAARAALGKHMDIAAEAYLLNKANKKGATRLVAEKYGMDSSEISRICANADVKQAVAAWFGGITAADAAEELKRAAQEETSRKKNEHMT